MANPLGDYIRRQRELNELTMRQFAGLVGISNPYLSQIERGLREPSREVLDAIADSLEVSAEALYEQAGRSFREDHDGPPAADPAVVTAIRADDRLTGRQKQALLELYAALSGNERWRRRR